MLQHVLQIILQICLIGISIKMFAVDMGLRHCFAYVLDFVVYLEIDMTYVKNLLNTSHNWETFPKTLLIVRLSLTTCENFIEIG